MIVSSFGSAIVVMFTSPLPVVSMMSTILGFPSVVTYRPMNEERKNITLT